MGGTTPPDTRRTDPHLRTRIPGGWKPTRVERQGRPAQRNRHTTCLHQFPSQQINPQPTQNAKRFCASKNIRLCFTFFLPDKSYKMASTYDDTPQHVATICAALPPITASMNLSVWKQKAVATDKTIFREETTTDDQGNPTKAWKQGILPQFWPQIVSVKITEGGDEAIAAMFESFVASFDVSDGPPNLDQSLDAIKPMIRAPSTNGLVPLAEELAKISWAPAPDDVTEGDTLRRTYAKFLRAWTDHSHAVATSVQSHVIATLFSAQFLPALPPHPRARANAAYVTAQGTNVFGANISALTTAIHKVADDMTREVSPAGSSSTPSAHIAAVSTAGKSAPEPCFHCTNWFGKRRVIKHSAHDCSHLRSMSRASIQERDDSRNPRPKRKKGKGKTQKTRRRNGGSSSSASASDASDQSFRA